MRRGNAPEARLAVLGVPGLVGSLALSAGARPGPKAPKAAVEALGRRLVPRAPRGGERRAGAGRVGRAFSPGLCSEVHVAPAAAVRRAARGGGPGRGDWCWWVVEGVFGEGVALGTEALPDSEFISVINSKLLYSENAVPLIEQAR